MKAHTNIASGLHKIAKSPTNTSRKTPPHIIIETSDLIEPIKNWRTLTNIKHFEKRQWVSTSATPSPTQLTWVKQQIRQLTHDQVKHMLVIDLRQESHGFLNNRSITLYAPHNWVNQGKTHDEAIDAETKWLASIANRQTLVSHKGAKIVVQQIANENTVAKVIGFDYERLTVPDHTKPADSEVDRFLTIYDQLQPDTWIHLHCRGGAGRASTFLALLLMLKHANTTSFDEIITLIASVPPHYDLRVGSANHPEYEERYRERYAFVREFYQFALARFDNQEMTWREWQRQNTESNNVTLRNVTSTF